MLRRTILWKHLPGRIKRRLKRLFRVDWTVDDMNEHIAYKRAKKLENRVNAWSPGKYTSKRKD